MNTLHLIHRLKKEGQSPQNHIKIESLRNINACLRPVQTKREDARLMAKWRREIYQSFFTWIQPSEAEMLEWLMHYENVDNDIIFLVEALGGEPIGQLSIYNVDTDKKLAEFGRLIRGGGKAPRGIMSQACAALLRWAFSCLQLKKIGLEVFADNQKAISIYKRLGFRVSNILLFRRIHMSRNVVRWVEAKKENALPMQSKYHYREVCRMALNRQDFGRSQ